MKLPAETLKIFLLLLPLILLTVAAAVFFSQMDRLKRWGRISSEKRQWIIGGTFGVIACAGTQFGIPYKGAQINVRSAAPLFAGLLFGEFPGILSGLIGALYRWFSV